MSDQKQDAIELASPSVPALKEVPQSAKMTRMAAFTPTNLTEAIAFSKMIAASELAPKDYKGKPANVLIAMQMGAEVGLAPMQAIQNIAVINGRPSLWGDAALAVVQVSPLYESHEEWFDGENDAYTAYCRVKRKGQPAVTASFSVGDAKKAKLWTKDGPWQTYPKRMLQMRARGFALRDKFADALRGLILAEEAMDIPPDTSEAKRQRDAGSVEIEPLENLLSSSSEPNRGHGNEGMGQQKQPPAQKQPPSNTIEGEVQKSPKVDELCSECRVINGHKKSCPHYEAWNASRTQDKKTSKPTKQIEFMIVTAEQKSKGDKKWLVLSVVEAGGQGAEFLLTVWDTALWEYLGPDSRVIGEYSETKRDNRTYCNLEHVSNIDGIAFVNDKPVSDAGEMPPQ